MFPGTLPAIDPMPPWVPTLLPWVGAGACLLRNPTRFFAAMRRRLGDTYVVDAFGHRLLCVFSPAGVRALYALREDEASFGLATYKLSRTYRVGAGVLVATMLSVNNTSAAPGLDVFDPVHFEGRRLASDVPVAARELVSTFGHGLHACPAQRFAIAAIRVAVERLSPATTSHRASPPPRRPRASWVRWRGRRGRAWWRTARNPADPLARSRRR